MGFKDAISSGFRNYIGFSGRAARSEYWYWAPFILLLQIVAWLIDMTLFGFNTTGVLSGSYTGSLNTHALTVSINRRF